MSELWNRSRNESVERRGQPPRAENQNAMKTQTPTANPNAKAERHYARKSGTMK
jgi:hypothetical protein